jgi:hypothetical protein
MLIDSPWMVDPLANDDDWLGRVVDESVPWSAVANDESQKMWKSIADTKAAALATTGGYRVMLKGMGHPDFTDQIFMSPLKRFSQAGAVAPARAAQILNAYVLAFFQETLLDAKSALLLEETKPFPEATLETWKAGSPAAT